MEYTVQQLAGIAGVSTRTLRYYDEIGLLKPARSNTSGYRIYGSAEVDRLQQILFYRELGFSLVRVQEVMNAPEFQAAQALKEHHKQLLAERERINVLIANVETTIAVTEGRTKMEDPEKFKGFKQKLIEDNEKKYGQEIRAKYGEEQVNASNEKALNMTEAELDEVSRLANEVNITLSEAMKSGDPAGELAQKAAHVHKLWLCYYWNEYSKEAHAGLARMYVDDERFRAYYDAVAPGAAEFLRDAVLIYTDQQ